MLQQLIDAYRKQNVEKQNSLLLKILSESEEMQFDLLKQAIAENAPQEVIHLLLEAGIHCAPDPLRPCQETPLFVAVKACRLEIVKLLISYKESRKISLEKGDYLITPLVLCFARSFSGDETDATRKIYTKMVEKLLNAGASGDSLFENKQTRDFILSIDKSTRFPSYFKFDPDSCDPRIDKTLTPEKIKEKCAKALLVSCMKQAVLTKNKAKLIMFLGMGGYFLEQVNFEYSLQHSATFQAVTCGAIDLVQFLFMQIPYATFQKMSSALLGAALLNPAPLKNYNEQMACLLLLMGGDIRQEVMVTEGDKFVSHTLLSLAQNKNFMEVLRLATIVSLIPQGYIQSIISQVEESYLEIVKGDFRLSDKPTLDGVIHQVCKDAADVLYNRLKDHIAENIMSFATVFPIFSEGPAEDKKIKQLLVNSIKERIIFQLFPGHNALGNRKHWETHFRDPLIEAQHFKSIVELYYFILGENNKLKQQATDKGDKNLEFTDITNYASIMSLIYSYLPTTGREASQGFTSDHDSPFSERVSLQRESSLVKLKLNHILPIVKAYCDEENKRQQDMPAALDASSACAALSVAASQAAASPASSAASASAASAGDSKSASEAQSAPKKTSPAAASRYIDNDMQMALAMSASMQDTMHPAPYDEDMQKALALSLGMKDIVHPDPSKKQEPYETKASSKDPIAKPLGVSAAKPSYDGFDNVLKMKEIKAALPLRDFYAFIREYQKAGHTEFEAEKKIEQEIISVLKSTTSGVVPHHLNCINALRLLILDAYNVLFPKVDKGQPVVTASLSLI